MENLGLDILELFVEAQSLGREYYKGLFGIRVRRISHDDDSASRMRFARRRPSYRATENSQQRERRKSRKQMLLEAYQRSCNG